MKKVGLMLACLLLLTGCSETEIQRGMELRGQLLRGTACTFDVAITADYGQALYQFRMACQADSQGNMDFTVTHPETISGITGHISHGQGAITADYGQALYQFRMACQADSQGNMDFTVTHPETISGITGHISHGQGSLTFSDTALDFPLMADDQLDSQGNMDFTVTHPETISGITGHISHGQGSLTFSDTALDFPLMADDQLSPVSAPWVLLKTLRSGSLTAACQEEEWLHLSLDDDYEEDALHLDVWLDGKNVPRRGEILYDGRRILSLDVENFQIQ